MDEGDLIEYVCFENQEEFENGNSTTAVDSQSKSSTWTRSETIKLIEAYDQYKESFTHVKQRKHAWEMIATHLQALDVMKLAKDCSLKWNNLLRTYKTAKDNKNKTGRGPIRFEFFDIMDTILGTKASNTQDGIGVNVGAYTEGMDSISSADNVINRPLTGCQKAPNRRKRKINSKEEYYKLKSQRLREKSENERELINIEKEKVNLLKQLIEKM